MDKSTLLLNHDYSALQFVTEVKAIKLIINSKVQIVTNWDETIACCVEDLKMPAVLRMKYRVVRPYHFVAFSRAAVFKRDDYTCQYCAVKIPVQELTMD